jgi:DNA-directed RNA polymerase specialized sigma24 family protein
LPQLPPQQRHRSLVAGRRSATRPFLAVKAAGYSYDEIAQQLGVTWRTVNRQLRRERACV